jgi:hypothetical protein
MRKFLAFTLGISTGLKRFCERQLGKVIPKYNNCTCVNMVLMEANPDCPNCFGTGLKPKEDYNKGILITYHKYESPLRHLKPWMSENQREVYRRALESRNIEDKGLHMPGPSYREGIAATWTFEPYEQIKNYIPDSVDGDLKGTGDSERG